MSEEESTEEESQDVQDWAEQNFNAVKNKMQQIQKEMRNSKPQENINVRKVDTDEGEKVVVEYSVQRWYSKNYFKKMLEDENEEDTLF